ncbi:Site-specific recombinase XerD [Hymenobacter gelipurpurascens]|uniref:Site-specific recombinase XerD n=1 Tax=Hymenobacter gelipurpurascens TaxID=89968 RepID=A0A212T7X1_9BACT|nr:hypothetical protein [Hymenobacter gelipurpurascens]SNC62132.1 Site-specific recombinase XerD [Hymenobacter gelipurpurascens]
MARIRQAFYNKFRLHVYLRRPNSEGFHQVRIVCYFHGTDFSVSPGLLILPERKTARKTHQLFEPKTGRVLSDHPEADYINEELGKWEKKLRDAFRTLAGPLGTTQVTRDMMEEAVFPATTPSQAPAPAPLEPGALTISAHYQQWQQENEGLHSASHLRHYQHVVDQLEKWKPNLLASQLTEQLVQEWRRKLVARGDADGSIAEHYKFFRLLATRIGLNPKAPWLRYKAVHAVQLDLTREELQALLVVQLDDPRLAEERDRWLLQCFSGRRDSDMRLLSPQQITTLRTAEGETVTAIRHYQGKTAAEVLLPLPPVAVRIGERWQWQLPERVNRRRTGQIKEVAKLAGLNRMFNDAKISNGQVTDNYRPVWEVIGTHTARHTAGSLLLEFSGGDKSLAAYLLGHAQNATSTDIYAKDKAKRVAGPLLQAWEQILGPHYDADPAGWVHAEDGGPIRAKQYVKRKKTT